MAFEIVSCGGFPEEVSGILVPDDGHKIHFRDGIENYYGGTRPIIGLFLSEHATTLEIPSILAGVELTGLAAIVTFGIHRDTSRLGTTHLDVITRELKLPLLRLKKPEEYPDYDRGQNHYSWLADVHIPGWVNSNPLRALYHQEVSVVLSDNVATIEPAGVGIQ